MRGKDSPGSVLRPGISAWKRPEAAPRRRPWAMAGLPGDGLPDDDLPDPETLARETVAEIQGALEGLVAILDLLGASSLSRSGEVGARSAGRSSETPPLASRPWGWRATERRR
jgi:hypothetical protein